MFNTKRIRIIDSSIFIDKAGLFRQKAEEHLSVLIFQSAVPVINVFENGRLIRTFKLETLKENPDLTSQFFHISVRILENEGVMIDGIISKYSTHHPNWQDKDYEAIRFQPFYLSSADIDLSNNLIGKGLFERGIHFSGTVTPITLRAVCVCDVCNVSFTVQHFHGGFSESQYFYSDDAKQTLIAGYYEIENIPSQLQNEIDETAMLEVESKLPLPTTGTGRYRYYNSFRCPHCEAPFIDFEKNKLIRPTEYYGLRLINHEFQNIKDNSSLHN
ncbi:MAG TPA: hypothetical protein VKB19_09360 [Pedobacter sp.]|nr:hypothetical protein [Pedobacter sp.]